MKMEENIIKAEIVDSDGRDSEIPLNDLTWDERGNIVEFYKEETVIESEQDKLIRADGEASGFRSIDDNGKHVCSECEMAFPHKDILLSHVRSIHEEVRKFMCGVCNRTFTEIENLKTHIVAVHGDGKEFTCRECGRSYSYKINLTKHLERKHKILTKADDENRLQTKTPESLKPEFIKSGTFSTGILLSCDQKTRFHVEGTTIYSAHGVGMSDGGCIPLNQNFDIVQLTAPVPMTPVFGLIKSEPSDYLTEESSGILENNLSQDNHLKSYICSECNRAFARKGDLNNHIAVCQSTLKTFKCSECNQAFKWHDCLKKHIKTKHDYLKKKFACKQCDCSYSRKRNLTRHLMCKHTQIAKADNGRRVVNFLKIKAPKNIATKFIKSRTFPTGLLGRRGQEPSIYVAGTTQIGSSQNKHCGYSMPDKQYIKPYICSECNKTFTRKGDLIDHITVCQSTLKTFKCSECNHAFKWYDCLKKHIQVVHGDLKKYTCEECDVSYIWKYHLEKHLNRFHRHTADEPRNIVEFFEGETIFVKSEPIDEEETRCIKATRDESSRLEGGATERRNIRISD